MKHLEVVEVHWVDSEARIGWTNVADLSKGLVVISVGFLAHESSDMVTLSISYDGSNEEWNPLISIPKVAIKKRKTLCRMKMK